MRWISWAIILFFIVGVTDWALANKESKTEKRIRTELNKVCDLYKQANEMTEKPEFKDYPRKVDEKLEQNINSKIKMDSVRKIWKNLKIADPANKYEFWMQAADDLGVKNWTCTEIEKYYPEVAK